MATPAPALPQPSPASSTPFKGPSAASPSSFRILSHWTKSTPEEGIQIIFNAAEVLHAGQNGVQVHTHPPSTERPCQWAMNLRLIHSPSPLSPPHLPPEAPCSSRTASPFATEKPKAPAPVRLSSTSHLILTLDRSFQHNMGASTGANMEDPARVGRTRHDAYRTLYIYSPKLKRDICVHSIKRDSWPQSGNPMHTLSAPCVFLKGQGLKPIITGTHHYHAACGW